MTDDLKRQYELALLVDFFGPCQRLIRVAGLEEAEVAAREASFHLVPGDVASVFVPVYTRGMSILALALQKHGRQPTDPAIEQAMDEVFQGLQSMQKWGS